MAEKDHELPVKITILLVQDRTWYRLNASLDCCPYTTQFYILQIKLSYWVGLPAVPILKSILVNSVLSNCSINYFVVFSYILIVKKELIFGSLGTKSWGEYLDLWKKQTAGARRKMQTRSCSGTEEIIYNLLNTKFH